MATMSEWWDTQISVTRESLSILCGREIPLEEWMLISSLNDTSSLGQEDGTEHFWNAVDQNFGVYHICTIGPSDLQAYMVASKKYLSKPLWKKLVDADKQDYEECMEKYDNEDYFGDMMRDVLKEIDVPSHCGGIHISYSA